jgi:hypothetical protein
LHLYVPEDELFSVPDISQYMTDSDAPTAVLRLDTQPVFAVGKLVGVEAHRYRRHVIGDRLRLIVQIDEHSCCVHASVPHRSSRITLYFGWRVYVSPGFSSIQNMATKQAIVTFPAIRITARLPMHGADAKSHTGHAAHTSATSFIATLNTIAVVWSHHYWRHLSPARSASSDRVYRTGIHLDSISPHRLFGASFAPCDQVVDARFFHLQPVNFRFANER